MTINFFQNNMPDFVYRNFDIAQDIDTALSEYKPKDTLSLVNDLNNIIINRLIDEFADNNSFSVKLSLIEQLKESVYCNSRDSGLNRDIVLYDDNISDEAKEIFLKMFY